MVWQTAGQTCHYAEGLRGGVAFQIEGKTGPIGQCHCSKCRKVSGTDGNAVFYAGAQSFRWVRGQDWSRVLFPTGTVGIVVLRHVRSPVPLIDREQKKYCPPGLLDDDTSGYAAIRRSKAPWVTLTDDAPKFVEGFGSARVDQR
jgi:hypothetical protein